MDELAEVFDHVNARYSPKDIVEKLVNLEGRQVYVRHVVERRGEGGRDVQEDSGILKIVNRSVVLEGGDDLFPLWQRLLTGFYDQARIISTTVDLED